ncbi:hypothetical protein V8E55_006900 [Tylopilus felleus]
MAPNPNTDAPHSHHGWLDSLFETMSNMITTVRDALSRFFRALWADVVAAGTTARNFGASQKFPWWRLKWIMNTFFSYNSVREHPKLVIALVILILAVLLVHPVTRMIVREIFGFGSPGVRGGSFATRIQANFFGGFVPAGSIFSFFQSFGAR